MPAFRAVWVRRSILQGIFAACMPSTPASAPFTYPHFTPACAATASCRQRRLQLALADAPLQVHPSASQQSSVAITNRECALVPGAGCRPYAGGRPMKLKQARGATASANQTERSLQAVLGVIGTNRSMESQAMAQSVRFMQQKWVENWRGKICVKEGEDDARKKGNKLATGKRGCIAGGRGESRNNKQRGRRGMGACVPAAASGMPEAYNGRSSGQSRTSAAQAAATCSRRRASKKPVI